MSKTLNESTGKMMKDKPLRAPMPGSGSGPSNMDMKKSALKKKIASKKPKKTDTSGFLSVEQVKKLKKAGKFKGFDANPENSSTPKE